MAPFTIHQAIPSDLDEMVDVWVQACKEDTNWRLMMGSMTAEQEYTFVKSTIRARVEIGVEIGALQSWKIVDEENWFAIFPFRAYPHISFTPHQKSSDI